MTMPPPRPVDPMTHARIRLLIKARDMWIAGNPDLNERWERAQQQVQSTDDAVLYAGLEEISSVLREAVEAVGGVRR
ncbi:hypothetical protein OG785_45370 [Streptomyces sp. NBC_00006]|uniref:hypothetical protein n=1 Tax=Streptomyces sp. NBC_00006 TaxID=2975619 RepID=UPI00225B575D|nr:hypothetical protein [Streptomyces sp. NBC_00006]MCX5528978.1 hypothetical protein [Streptomyces sp. NBC_00006]MCX5537790.1 hypothetical protein [Streptomyces sp. NBC_00006]